jgi:transcriptional regulator with XRE-family HTH domain
MVAIPTTPARTVFGFPNKLLYFVHTAQICGTMLRFFHGGCPVFAPLSSLASSSRLKAERERLSLSVRNVSLLTRDIAKQRDNSDYYIAHSTLANIENGKQMPGICKLYSLSVIYRRRFDELAAWCGVPIADAEKEHRALAFPRTYLLGSPPEDAARVILTASELRQKLRAEPTNLFNMRDRFEL